MTAARPRSIDRREETSSQPAQVQASVSSAGMLSNSMAGSVWTIVSRVTGLGKVIAVGAVLGATYLGNTYQSVNSLPNLIYYQLLAGSLFASLLVPPLVAHIDAGDRLGAERLIGGFLGRLLVVAAGVMGVVLVASHLIVRLLTLGVSDHATAALQNRVGWTLLVMFVPQIALYAVAGTGAAIMNAHGRFALAAGAPTLENVGIIAVLAVASGLFGVSTDIANISTSEVLLLGFGTTGAVAIHATCQWLGARSSGIRFRPLAGWRDAEVRTVMRRIPPTLAYTGLAASQIFAVLMVANRIPGGLVAFQLALNFFYLPVAIVAWPVARALLPQLSRFHRDESGTSFRNELVRGVTLASFMTIPIAVAYVTLSFPMARAVTFGQLGTTRGVSLVAISLATLGLGVVGETMFILGTYAFYARQDVRSPLRSMAVRVGVSLTLMTAAWLSHGPQVLALLGLSLSAGSLTGAVHIGLRLRRALPSGDHQLLRPLGRTLVAALVMAVPAYLATLLLGHLGGNHLVEVGTMVAGAMVGLIAFLAAQAALHSPELAQLRSGWRTVRAGR
jgi:putative peptidoglycan lipid II flippase